MPMRPPRPCTFPGCGALVRGTSRCPEHTVFVRRWSDRARRQRDGRVYDATHVRRFRTGVLRRDPYCTCDLGCSWHGPRCAQPSTDADHYPIDRRVLVERGLDPNDPARGRGLCHRCHSSATARNQPGGWHRPRRPAVDGA